MLRKLLALFGYRIEYRSEFGVHDARYSGVDAAMQRPIHPDMSVAPPWAKRKFVKSK